MVVNQGVVCIPARGPNSTEGLFARTPVLGATTVVALTIASPYAKVGLVRFKVQRAAGAAATFTPYLFSEAGVTAAGNISQEYAGASTAVATLFDPQLGDAPVVMQCDHLGRIYMMLAPNAGSDNTFDYCLRFFKYE